jgi:DNA ligase-associated metallophosphoesterase
MTAPLHLAGTRLQLDPLGAVFWPGENLLAVADLHLEKGSAAAHQGHLVPPWDTRATLDRLSVLVHRYRPATLVALGDSFQDGTASTRMQAHDRQRLEHLASGITLHWVLGNHDATPPVGVPGTAVAEFHRPPFSFRHIPRAASAEQPEICGHFHPKARVAARGAQVTRSCYIADAMRLMLPAFGAYTGGLDVSDPAIASLFPRGARVFLLGRQRLFSFSTAPRRAGRSSLTPEQAIPYVLTP